MSAAFQLPQARDSAAVRFHNATSMLAIGEALPAVAVPSARAAIALPAVAIDGPMSLEAAIMARRSRRDFAARPMPLASLARLLALGCGVLVPRPDLPGGRGRAAPSAGATYPLNAHVLASRVTGLSPGSYRYEVQTHRLIAGRAGGAGAEFAHWALGQQWLADAAAIIMLTGVPARITPRYAARGYRYMLFEAGHIAQNMCLLAAVNGLAAQTGGGFVDAAVARLLALPTGEMALYFVAVGPGE